MKQLIVISPDETYDSYAHRPFYIIKRSYGLAVAGAGGLPVMATDPKMAGKYAEICSGLILTDGDSLINPGRFGEEISEVCGYESKSWYDYHFNYVRDSMDIVLCKAFMEKKKPVLGIGRGMHIVNIVLGGTLCNTGWRNGMEPVSRRIIRCKESFIPAFMGENEVEVHEICREQKIRKLGRGLKVVADSEDDDVEAIVHNTLPIIGVGWNPEMPGTNDETYISSYKNNKAQDGNLYPIANSPEVKEKFMIHHKNMKSMPGFPSDKNYKLIKNEKVFNFFIELCSREQ